MPLPITATEALEQLRTELLAMPSTTLPPSSLDAHATAMMVLSLVEPITAHRAALLELGGERAVRSLDRLELVALAALGADLEVTVSVPGTDVTSIAAELHRLRQLMRAELQLLTQRGHLDERVGRALTNRRSHHALCLDVLLLTTIFETHWALTEAHTSLTRSQLAAAQALANELMEALGPETPSPAVQLRGRALALLVQTYGEVQRAVSYLRWHQGDADLIAPSLWKRAGAGRRKNRRPSDEITQREPARADGLRARDDEAAPLTSPP